MSEPLHPDKAVLLAEIMRLWRSGQNTCEIAKAVDLDEALVAIAIRASRERSMAVSR